MGGAAVLAIVAAQLSGRLLARLGPVRVAPALFAANAALFVVEWVVLGWQPRAAAVLLYLHSTVLGAIAISAYWSLLNERFDPHSAKSLMSRVAGAATFGGLVGGVSAERVAALLPPGTLLPILGLVGAVCVIGTRTVGRGAPVSRPRVADKPDRAGAWSQFRRQPMLRDMALVIAMAAMLAALVDYLLKAEAVAYFGKGPQLVRFFGLFYSGTALAAVSHAGLPRASRARVSGSRRLGGHPPSPGGGSRPARVCITVSLARHSSPRTRRRRAQLSVPRGLRAPLHAISGGDQTLGQVPHRRRV